MAPITPRLDLNKEIVDKAKQAKALRDGTAVCNDDDLEGIHFSDTLAMAMDDYLEEVLDLLSRAGFRKRRRPLKASEKRPRRVDAKRWKELGKSADDRGVSRMDLVRALLTKLGDEYSPPMEGPPGESISPRDQPVSPPDTAVDID